jgi:GDPmannose 4,6-dehydratase
MRALITGITGQDGSYLAELLIDKGYEVWGVFQPGAGAGCLMNSPARHAVHELTAAVTDRDAIAALFQQVQPLECYHLAAQTFVPGAETNTIHTNVNGTWCILSALAEFTPECRLFFAGSSEMFGSADSAPQTEQTPFRPRSFYGVSKVAAYDFVRYYRDAKRIFACCGILYNHESPRRSPQFVTRKITRAAARIRAGLETELRLGNLDAVRDWGYAPDYVVAMWKALQSNRPDDYVIATGRGRTVREFVQAAFSAVDMDWHKFVVVDPQFWRPAEPVPLVGCATKALEKLGWAPERDFRSMIHEMVENDCHAVM